MGLRERLQGLFGRPKSSTKAIVMVEGNFMEVTYATAPDGTTVVTFPHAKTDFSDGVYGSSGFDLSNAHAKGVVVRGDVLEITAIHRPSDQEGKGVRLMYGEPDNGLFGGIQGNHKFLPEQPYVGMPFVIIEGEISSWEKVGHTTPEQWNAMRREVFGDRVIDEQGK